MKLPLDFSNIPALDQEWQSKSPGSAKLALASFNEIAISFSGAEDVVLIEMAHKLTDRLRVFPWTREDCIRKPIDLSTEYATIMI